MNYNPILIGMAISGLAYWYFNIKGPNKCIILDKKCVGAKCVFKNN